MFSSHQLIALREARGLTRSELHRALVRHGFNGCRALINRWETGSSEPSASEVAVLANVLDAAVAEFFAPIAPAPVA